MSNAPARHASKVASVRSTARKKLAEAAGKPLDIPGTATDDDLEKDLGAGRDLRLIWPLILPIIQMAITMPTYKDRVIRRGWHGYSEVRASKHFAEQALERDVLESQALAAIAAPDGHGPADTGKFRVWKRMPSGAEIEVVYAKEHDALVLVTTWQR